MANQAVSPWSKRQYKEISHGAIYGPYGPKTTPVGGFQHVRGQCGVVFHAKSNGEVNVQIS